MENKKGTTVLLTVIGIATLLVAVVGATFAYFTASVTPTNADKTNVTVTAAQLGTISFDNGNVIDLSENVYPGALQGKDFTVESDSNTTVAVDYTVGIDVLTNTFTTSNLEYFVCATAGTGSTINGSIPTCADSIEGSVPKSTVSWTAFTGTTDVTLGTAKLGPNGAEDTWKLFVRLKETGAAQNDDQGKSFTAKLTVNANAGYTTNAEGAVVTTN